MMCWRCIFSPNKALLSDKFAAERGVKRSKKYE